MSEIEERAWAVARESFTGSSIQAAIIERALRAERRLAFERAAEIARAFTAEQADVLTYGIGTLLTAVDAYNLAQKTIARAGLESRRAGGNGASDGGENLRSSWGGLSQDEGKGMSRIEKTAENLVLDWLSLKDGPATSKRIILAIADALHAERKRAADLAQSASWSNPEWLFIRRQIAAAILAERD
jgi:hypothetical protein